MRATARIGEALRFVRSTVGLSQEEFGIVSSRTYVSSVERGLKSPTLGKIEQLAEVLGVHTLTLLVLAYMNKTDSKSLDEALTCVRGQILELIEET